MTANGKRSLHSACQNGEIEIVKCLIKDGAQIDMQDTLVSDES